MGKLLQLMGALWLAVIIFPGCTDATDPATGPAENQESQMTFPSSTLEDSAFYSEVKSLISPSALKEMIANGEDFVLVDVRPQDSFVTGHLPGAYGCWRSDFNQKIDSIDGMRASKAQLENLLGKMNTTPEKLIVLYDDRGNVNSARLWWILRLYGHEHIALLNGGLQGWIASGGELTTEILPFVTQKYLFQGAPAVEWLAELDEVKAIFEQGGALLLDTRKPEEFLGEKLKSGAFRAGRIPGALLMDYVEMVFAGEGEDFSFRSIPEMREKLVKNGISSDKKIITYCHSGARSAHTTFVLTQLLGFDQVANYDGSWIEWSYHSDLPIQTEINLGSL